MRTDSVTCVASDVGNVPVNCQFTVNNDLLAALGIEDHPMEANVTVLNGGWIDILIEKNVEADPNFEAYVFDVNSGLFEEGGVCRWSPDIDVSNVDWDACGAAMVEFVEGWMAETGRS